MKFCIFLENKSTIDANFLNLFYQQEEKDYLWFWVQLFSITWQDNLHSLYINILIIRRWDHMNGLIITRLEKIFNFLNKYNSLGQIAIFCKSLFCIYLGLWITTSNCWLSHLPKFKRKYYHVCKRRTSIKLSLKNLVLATGLSVVFLRLTTLSTLYLSSFWN